MAQVGLARELADSPSGEIGLESARFTRRFAVEVSSFADGPMVAMNAVGVPPYLSEYNTGNESFIVARCRNKSAERLDDNSLIWIVTCEYETVAREEEEEEEQEENPLFAPPEISMSFEQVEQSIMYSTDNVRAPDEPIKNSAGEIIQDLPTKIVSYPTITITRNEHISSPIIQIAQQYADAVNSDAFAGAAAGQAKIQGIEVSRQVKTYSDGSTMPYLTVTYNIAFRPDGWDIYILDKGKYYIDANGHKQAFKTDDGHEYEGLLDEQGDQTTEPHYLGPYQIYPKLPFSALNLPQGF